jgi:hypothetical protein
LKLFLGPLHEREAVLSHIGQDGDNFPSCGAFGIELRFAGLDVRVAVTVA